MNVSHLSLCRLRAKLPAEPALQPVPAVSEATPGPLRSRPRRPVHTAAGRPAGQPVALSGSLAGRTRGKRHQPGRGLDAAPSRPAPGPPARAVTAVYQRRSAQPDRLVQGSRHGRGRVHGQRTRGEKTGRPLGRQRGRRTGRLRRPGRAGRPYLHAARRAAGQPSGVSVLRRPGDPG